MLKTYSPEKLQSRAEAHSGGPAWDEEKLARWGFEEGLPPALGRFAVELDQKFLTELAHTAAMFSELFEVSGRPRLLKVTIPN